jgi:hydrogenase maturation protease
MNQTLAEKIANAVLYEGYILYPYRPSALKNRQRFNFGVLLPPLYSAAQPGAESWLTQTECLMLGAANTTLEVKARFLHLRERSTSTQGSPCWQEAVEREMSVSSLRLPELGERPQSWQFFFPAARETETRHDARGGVTGEIVRRQAALEATVEVRLADGGAQTEQGQLFRLTVRVSNQTPFENARYRSRDEALLYSLVSTHTILRVRGGEFISLLDPPAQFRAAAAACQNVGAWPALVGAAGTCDTLLSSPIILYDYPQIAPESAGDFFEGAEIDEMLTLRVLTLTDEEKHEVRDGDARAREILERTEALPVERLMKLHGALRGLRPSGRQ